MTDRTGTSGFIGESEITNINHQSSLLGSFDSPATHCTVSCPVQCKPTSDNTEDLLLIKILEA